MGYRRRAEGCKGQSQAMLMAAAAKSYKMFVCVQDLTCPGASLDSLRRHLGARAGRRGDRGERAPIRARRQRHAWAALPHLQRA